MTKWPDNKFLIVSTQNDKHFPFNDTTNDYKSIPSDSLFTLNISLTNSTPSIVQRFPAGGISPRSFSLKKNGKMVVVALNTSNRLLVIAKNVTTGLVMWGAGLDLEIGDKPGLVMSAVWDEDEDGVASAAGSHGCSSVSSMGGTVGTSASAGSATGPAVATHRHPSK
jgi:hypothetical protein